MRKLKIGLAALAGLIVLLCLVAFALPGSYRVERSVVIAAPMVKVYPLVYDPQAWKQWGVWYRRDPGMQVTYSGPRVGVGARSAWKSASEGSGFMEFTEATFDKRIAYRIGFDDFDGVFNGRFEFAPEGKGVRVSWIAEGETGKNPLMRWFGLFMDRMLGPDFEGGLANLKSIAEAP